MNFLVGSNSHMHLPLLCRYEAGMILKQMCLKEHALGDILQILHMVITSKRWITYHPSGWQPLKINVPQIDTPSWVNIDNDRWWE